MRSQERLAGLVAADEDQRASGVQRVDVALRRLFVEPGEGRAARGRVHYLTQMRQTIAAAHELRHEDVEATAPDELLSAFRAWQRGEILPESRQS